MHNYYYIPNLGINLILQFKLANITTTILDNTITLFYKNTLLTQGNKINNLYYLPIQPITSTTISNKNRTLLTNKSNTQNTTTNTNKVLDNISYLSLTSNTTKTNNISNNNNLNTITTTTNSSNNSNSNNSNSNTSNNSSSIKQDIEYSNLIYKRFAHCGINALKAIKPNTIGINNLLSLKELCELYIQANLTNKCYRNTTLNKDYTYLERIHSNLIGPINPPDILGYKYIIIFLDYKTRTLDIELLKHKYKALDAFKKYKVRKENNSSNNKIYILFTNNSTEYINKEFNNYFIKYSIKY